MEAFAIIGLVALGVFIWAHLPNHDEDTIEEYWPTREQLP